MTDATWTLAYASTVLTLGPPAADAWVTEAVALGVPDLTTEDSNRPRTDGVAMGQDYFGGRTITFPGLACNDATRDLALARYGKLATAWRADSVRKVPGAVATLTVDTPGRERLVYGRPRRLGAPVLDLEHQGYISTQADFACVDDVFYGATEQSVSVASGASATITVAGDLAAWPVIVLTNTSSSCTVTVGGYALTLSGLTTTTATLDTRPWVRTIRSATGINLAGKLSRTARLGRAGLTPGSRTVSVTGADMALSWRPTYTSL